MTTTTTTTDAIVAQICAEELNPERLRTRPIWECVGNAIQVAIVAGMVREASQSNIAPRTIVRAARGLIRYASLSLAHVVEVRVLRPELREKPSPAIGSHFNN